MSLRSNRPFRRLVPSAAATVAAGVLVVGCTSNDPEETSDSDDAGEEESTDNGGAAASGNDEPGETVTIGFSGPLADHGWLAAGNRSAAARVSRRDRPRNGLRRLLGRR